MGSDGFQGKGNLWMPLDIAEWRRDTNHLSPTEKAAYLALKISYWEHGYLPNDPDRLALIAQVSPDTWRNTQVALSIGFFEQDGPVLHLSLDRTNRAKFSLKRQKAREKAIKAINARWSKYKAKQDTQGSSKSDSPSIQGEILENNSKRLSVIPSTEVQNLPPPTPPARRVGIDRAQGDTPSTAPKKNENKAKPPKQAAGSTATGLNARSHREGAGTGRAGLRSATARPFKNGVNPENADSRRQGFKDEVLHYWRDLNPEYSKYEFTDADDRALTQLLDRQPELSLKEFRRLLQNRASSAINPAAAPHKWLRSILEYSAGPMDPFGKPRTIARSL